MLVEYLKKKPVPFFFLDTHAGCGTCDLSEAEAQRSSEYQTAAGFSWFPVGPSRMSRPLRYSPVVICQRWNTNPRIVSWD